MSPEKRRLKRNAAELSFSKKYETDTIIATALTGIIILPFSYIAFRICKWHARMQPKRDSER